MNRYLIALLTVTLSPAFVMAASDAAHAAEAHAHGEEALTPFAGTPYQSIAALIAFTITFAVLAKFAWGPIIKGLKEREDKIRHDLQQAEDAAKAAVKTLDEYKAKILAANDEARKIIEQSKKDAQLVADQIKAQTEADINQMKTRAQADINSAKELAIGEIYAQTATLATEVAGKILKRSLTADDQKALVEESISALKQASRN